MVKLKFKYAYLPSKEPLGELTIPFSLNYLLSLPEK